jgi:hypothetical protein
MASGQLHAPAALPQGKSPWYPLDRRLGGPQSRSGRGGEEKNSHPPPGIEPQNPDRQARSPALYRLSYSEVKEWVQLYLHSPNTSWRRGAQLKHKDNFTLPRNPTETWVK